MIVVFKLQIWSVSDISSAIAGTLEKNFGQIAIKGEVSNLTRSNLGHIYFSLKDQSAIINAICFAFIAKNLPLRLENGMKIVVCGKLTTYQERSQYQVQVHSIKFDGIGDMMIVFNALREKFRLLGYFNEDKKKKLPKFPKKIGLITSQSGAVIHDICSKMDDKLGCVLQIFDSQVQGEMAVSSVICGIDFFEKTKVDVIIIARGGGSFEDLFCFNDERLIERIFCCKIPIVSAIGHESDFTLCDFVSDVRASTPTHAASIVFPSKQEIMYEILNMQNKINQITNERIATSQMFLDLLSGFIVNFERRIADISNLIESVRNKMIFWLKNTVFQLNTKSNHALIMKEYLRKGVINNLSKKDQQLKQTFFLIEQKLSNLIEKNSVNLQINFNKISSLNPKFMLNRGYSIVYQNGKILNKVRDVKSDVGIEILMKDGLIKVKKDKS